MPVRTPSVRIRRKRVADIWVTLYPKGGKRSGFKSARQKAYIGVGSRHPRTGRSYLTTRSALEAYRALRSEATLDRFLRSKVLRVDRHGYVCDWA